MMTCRNYKITRIINGYIHHTHHSYHGILTRSESSVLLSHSEERLSIIESIRIYKKVETYILQTGNTMPFEFFCDQPPITTTNFKPSISLHSSSSPSSTSHYPTTNFSCGGTMQSFLSIFLSTAQNNSNSTVQHIMNGSALQQWSKHPNALLHSHSDWVHYLQLPAYCAPVVLRGYHKLLQVKCSLCPVCISRLAFEYTALI